MTEPADDVVEVRPAPAPAAGRRRPIVIGALVLALVVLGGGITWAATRAGGSASAGGDGFACPAAVADHQLGAAAPAVPAPPSAPGVDGRLVPATAPESVLLCEYGVATGGVAGQVEAPPAGPSSANGGPASADPGPVASDAVPTTVPGEPRIVTGVGPANGGLEPSPAQAALGRSAEHAGGDEAVTALVTALQQATIRPDDTGYMSCLSYSNSDAHQYLIGLTYPGGTVWVSGPDACTGSTNGVTGSDLDISGPVAAALDTGSGGGVSVAPVPADPSVTSSPSSSTSPEPGTTGDPGVGVATGDPGSGGGGTDDDPNAGVLATCTVDEAPTSAPSDGTPLVPFTPTAVRICHVPVEGEATAADEPATVATALAGTLDTLPTLEPDTACSDIGSDRWLLLFTGDDGTRLTVSVDRGGCGTASDGTRTVQAGASLFAQLDALR